MMKKDRVTEPPLVNYTVPADTEHLFCKNCVSMYKKNKYPHANHILLAVHPDSRGAEMKEMMSLLKAWAAFMNYFTGTQTTFTLGKLHQSGDIEHPETKQKTGWEDNEPLSVVSMTIGDDKPTSARGSGGYTSSGYAYMSGIGYVRFKSGILLSMPPASALAFMVHEFTSHRFSKDFEYILSRIGRSYAVRESPEEGIHAHRKHYGHEGHPFEETEHCATNRKSKFDRASINCLNGFIDHNFSNIKNALPFFQRWYDDHKDDSITMYGSPAPSPAPRRRLSPPAPSPAPSGSIDVELMAVEMMPIDNKEIISNPGGPLTDFTAFGDFYDVIRNAPSYESVNKPSSKMTGDPRGQLINAKYATKHFNAYVEKAKEIYGISGDADWANNDENKEPVYVATYQLKRGHTLYGIGDLHSGIHSLTSILSKIGVTDDWRLPDKTKVVFCGDYLDRGPYSIECLYAVTKLHINNPNRVVLIEGNHEDHDIFESYGAKDEMVSQYSEDFDAAYEATLRTLRSMPTAAFFEIEGSSKAIQFCHGGMVSEDDPTYSKIKEARDTKRLTKISSNDTMHQLKWADFGDEKSKPANLSKGRPKFSVDSVAEYCNDLNLHGIISGHQDKFAFQIQAHRIQPYPPYLSDEANQIADKIRASGGFANHVFDESGLVIEILPNKPQVIKLGKDTQSIITSAATPTRDDIKYPSFIRIRT
jgi:hypothetical protein